MSRIVSVWLPAWPIERMRRQSPASVPEAEPFALVEKGVHGLRISAANKAALSAGVAIGASLPDTRAALPGLTVLPAEPARDAHALHKLAVWLGRYGPARNIDGSDGAWVDVTGVPHLFGGEEALLEDLAVRLRRIGLTARIGLADTLGAAHALGRFGTTHRGVSIGAIALPGETRTALANLPVAALRLSPETTRLLIRLGLKRIGQLYGLPRMALAARFHGAGGSGGRSLRETAATAVLLRLDQALGLIAEPGKPLIPPPEARSRLVFPDPLITSDGIVAALGQLAAILGESLGRQGLGARRFRLVLYRTDATAAKVAIGTSTPCREPGHICRLMHERLSQIDAGFGIDVATLDADGLEPLAARQIGLGANATKAGTAGEETTGPAALVDRLSNRLGPNRVLRLATCESHLPERSEIWLPAIAGTPSSSSPTLNPSMQSQPTRPPFLLRRPEPISVIAEVPEGAPQHFVWRRVARRIIKAEGPERIAPEWWRHIGIAGRAPGTRDYYRLEDATGARYWVFRDGLYGENEYGADPTPDTSSTGDESPRWFVHGLFA